MPSFFAEAAPAALEPTGQPPRGAPHDDTWSGVRAVLAELCSRPAISLTPDVRLESDLAFDSLLLIELSVRLEERFDIVVPPSASPADLSIKTAADVVRLVDDLRAARRPHGGPEAGRDST